MKKIELFNRDGANLWLEEIGGADNNTSWWILKVDKKHKYCLEYMRVVFDKYPSKIMGTDPAGGPMLSLGDKLENGKYEIVDFLNSTTLKLLEHGNN